VPLITTTVTVALFASLMPVRSLAFACTFPCAFT
jgi:hypothetical protein